MGLRDRFFSLLFSLDKDAASSDQDVRDARRIGFLAK
jgi:hypothetical protein